MEQQTQFTEGKILGPLLKFAVPVLFAMFLQAMYGAVDLLVVGQFGAAADVSAVATGSQMMHSITSVIIGLAMGTTILMGQKIGQKKSDEAGDVIGGAVVIFAILAVFLTVVLMAEAAFLAGLMQAPEEAFDKTVIYIRFCSAGSLFIVAYNVLGSVFRGMGDSKTPLLTVAVACIVNIAGDLIFVGGLHMAAAGAALATVLAQAVSVILSLMLIRRRGLPFRFTIKNIRWNKAIILRTLRLGFPIALQEGLVGISFLAIMAIVNTLGVIPSAGVGVAEKLCGFIMLVPSSFMQSLSAFVAQNIGAGKRKRAVHAMCYGMLASLAIDVVIAYFAFFHGDILSAVFARDAQVILASADYLKAYAMDTLLVSFLFCFMGFFNGCGKTTFVMAEGIIGAFGVRIPVSYIMSRTADASLFKVGLAIPLSTIVQIILCVGFFIYLNRKNKEKSEDIEE